MDSNKTLLNSIIDEFNVCGFENSEILVKEIIETGNCLLLLDGLDEVHPEKQNVLIKEINNFSDKYCELQIIVTCRTASYKNWLDSFSNVEMSAFDKNQIVNFVSNYFNSVLPEQVILANELTSNCIEEIFEKSSRLELAQTPILLAFICIYYYKFRKLENNRTDLYNTAIGILMRDWDTHKNIHRVRKYSNITSKLEQSLLSELALYFFEKKKFFFKRKEISHYIDSFLSNKIKIDEFDAEEFLSDMESMHSLIVERHHGIYSFNHLTIQEYFTAKYIISHAETIDQRSIINHFGDLQWKEVFTFISGLSANCQFINSFFKLMIYEINKSVSNSRCMEKLFKELEMIDVNQNTKLPYFIIIHRIILYINFKKNERHSINDEKQKACQYTIDYIIKRVNMTAWISTVIEQKNLKKSFENLLVYESEFNEFFFDELVLYLNKVLVILECIAVNDLIDYESRISIVTEIAVLKNAGKFSSFLNSINL